jgi:hypothetical protein
LTLDSRSSFHRLFVGVISESTPVVYFRTLDKGQAQYECLLAAAGYSNNISGSSLAYLRSLDIKTLQSEGCIFGPNLDVEENPVSIDTAFKAGNYLHVPSIFGTTTDEGTDFAPQSLDTVAQAHQFLGALVPLSNNSLAILDELYFNKNETVFPNSGRK